MLNFFSVSDYYLFVKRAIGDYCLMILFFGGIICQYKGGEKWLQERWRPCIFC